MRHHQYRLPGDTEPVTVHRIEGSPDLDSFHGWLESHGRSLAVDVETTGLDIYSDSFGLRTVQVGTDREAWVIPVELGNDMAKAAYHAVADARSIIVHNGMFDLQVLERHLGLPMGANWAKTTDTRILAHLVDPRGPGEGGTGQSLEALTAALISEQTATETKGLMARLAKEHKTTKSRIWSEIDIDHPEYNLYAGMDTILTMRIARRLWTMVPRSAKQLVRFEHRVAEVCSYYERTGFLLDVDYTKGLSERLAEDEEIHAATAYRLGVENVNSTDQVAAALIEQGVTIPDVTPTGKPKVDKRLLDRLVGERNELAYAVSEAKKARKWRTTWVDGFLRGADSDGRCHAAIQPLRARTARMSITGIPAQTLPASDWMIRRCFLAEAGHSIVSVDYRSQELRVLAALSGDHRMIEAFRRGESLHMITAREAFGSGVVKDSKEYKIAKTANFQKVYGGGPRGLSSQVGVELGAARKVHQGFDSAYPAVKPYADRLAREASANGFVTTPSGRRLPVDPERSYSALNYCVSHDTAILRSDLRHVPASSIAVGDKLIGFDEGRPGGEKQGDCFRKFRTTEVELVSRVTKPSLRITDDEGNETVCSTDHYWLIRRPNAQPRFVWIRSDELKPGDNLLSVGVWSQDTSSTGGYLAGLYDGEGSLSGRGAGRKQTSLIFSQMPGLVMDAFGYAMRELGLSFSYYRRAPSSTSPTDTCVVHGVPNILRLLGTLRPHRFINRAAEVYEGAAIVGGNQLTDCFVSEVEPVGERELVSIQTSTRTLIANGYLSHNCVQSTSRDVTARGLLRLHDAGLTPYIRLPIHDEVVGSIPTGAVDYEVDAIAEAMTETMGPVVIDTDMEVGIRSWGSLHGSDY